MSPDKGAGAGGRRFGSGARREHPRNRATESGRFTHSPNRAPPSAGTGAMGGVSRSGASAVIRSAGSFKARSRPKIGSARMVARPPTTKPTGTDRSCDRYPRPVCPPTLPRLPISESNDTRVARSDVGIEAWRYVWRTGCRTPPATAPRRNTGTVIQKERTAPVATMVPVEAAAAPSRIVVLRRPDLASRPTKALPAIPARANSEAIKPDNQIASSPYSSRKYGCHAYHAHEKNPQVRNEYTTSNRTAGARHPYVIPAAATRRISWVMPRRWTVLGVKPISCIVRKPTANAPSTNRARAR